MRRYSRSFGCNSDIFNILLNKYIFFKRQKLIEYGECQSRINCFLEIESSSVTQGAHSERCPKANS